MTASDVEDDHSRSVSPEDSGTEQVQDIMAERQPRDEKPKPNGSTSTNPKDHSRPKRKKARRACYACQRAHLTCGRCKSAVKNIPMLMSIYR
jgi:hypothetical protein